MTTLKTAPENKVGKTAKLVAELLAVSDMPYARDIAFHCGAMGISREFMPDNPDDTLWAAPLIEMRLKSTLEAIKQFGTATVLDLASGMWPLGLILSENRAFDVTETDLDDMSTEKRRIVSQLTEDRSQRVSNLQVMPADALDLQMLRLAIGSLPKNETTICHAGLAQYFNLLKKCVLWHNVATLHRENDGGVYIMSDIMTLEQVEEMERSPKALRIMEAVSGCTGIDLKANAYKSDAEWTDLAMMAGFTQIQVFYQHHLVGMNMSSLNHVPNVDLELAQTAMRRSKIWVMRVD